MTDPDLRIGFIGLGAMGRPMAENLVKAGFAVTVFDVDLAAVESLVALGARAAASPAEVARTSNFVELIVRTSEQVEDVLFGGPDSAVSDNLAPGSVVLIHSTIPQSASTVAAERLAERGIDLLDAPVTGSIKGATDGTLTFIVGGTDAVVQRCAPVLDVLGSRTIHVGAPGAAQIAKLINNMLAGVNSVAIAEGLALARAAGLTEEAVLEVVNSGTGASFMSTNRDLVLRMGRHTDLIGLGYKDLQIALAEGHDQGVGLPVTALSTQYLKEYHV